MPDLAELVARYVRFRKFAKGFNSVLTGKLTKDQINEGARDLRMLRKGALFFNSEDEIAILMDYCLYNVLRQGQNTVQRTLADEPPSEGSEELSILKVMSEAWYSVFGIVRLEPGAGVWVEDVFLRTKHLLMDNNLSRSAVTGALMATRVFPLDGFITTSGAALPLQGDIAHRDQLIAKLTKVIFRNNIKSFDRLNPLQEKDLAKTIISTALRSGASSYVRYEDPGTRQSAGSPPPRQVPVRAGGRVGRNEPCPCGSGKKFKKCCAG